MAGTTSSILLHDTIHDEEELLNALILSQVLPTFHKVMVLLFVIATDCNSLRLSDGGHNQHLPL